MSWASIQFSTKGNFGSTLVQRFAKYGQYLAYAPKYNWYMEYSLYYIGCQDLCQKVRYPPHINSKLWIEIKLSCFSPISSLSLSEWQDPRLSPTPKNVKFRLLNKNEFLDFVKCWKHAFYSKASNQLSILKISVTVLADRNLWRPRTYVD